MTPVVHIGQGWPKGLSGCRVIQRRFPNSNWHYELCGVEAAIFVTNHKLEPRSIAYWFARLRPNRRYPSWGYDVPSFKICAWRDAEGFYLRIGKDTLQVSRDIDRAEFIMWIEDRLEEEE